MSTETYNLSFDPSSVLFSVKNNQIVNDSNIITNNNEIDMSTEEQEQQSDVILSILWKNDKMGAAYYKFNEHELCVVNDTTDASPYFSVIRALYREVNPIHTITFGDIAENFIKLLINTSTNDSSDDGTVISDTVKTLPPNLTLLSLKNYSYETCKSTVSQLTFAATPVDETETKREILLHSLINFDCTLSVYALGALIKFLEKNWGRFNKINDPLTFWKLTQISLKDSVYMDWNTFHALQIFQSRPHESGFKHGLLSSNREGLSIFKLLSEHCKSTIGKNCLKNILLKPTRDINELNKRLDFIEFAMNPVNRNFIESLQDNISKIVDVHLIINKIQFSMANCRDWFNLYKTILYTTTLQELCFPYIESCGLFQELCDLITEELCSLLQSIDNALDFNSIFIKYKRPVIKFGLDEELDAKKLRLQDISKHITAAAKFAVDKLPHYLNECSVVYIPEMGHLVAVKEWPNYDRNALRDMGFQFMFKVQGILHFKNPMCTELDRHLGNIHTDILAHESRIIQRLSSFVIMYNKNILEPLLIISIIDCLISLSKVAQENNYIRPSLNLENVHIIEDGRHPLLEIISAFESNDFHSGGDYSHMKIITGPNGSGKSVFLKQVALIVFLAHIGSFVPAKKANIGMVHSIHSRMHASESAVVRLSAFMIDISQIAHALHNAKATSLIAIDEFGRGTTGNEGIALLASTLRHFLNMKKKCPHILVSTHYSQVLNYLEESSLLKHLRMDHAKENDSFSFLFKVVEGISKNYTFDVVAAVDLGNDILNRAKEIYRSLKNNETINPLIDINNHQDDVEFFSNLDIPEPDD